MRRRILVPAIGGLSPDCLAAAHAPTIRQPAVSGGLAIGEAVMPSATNVNDVSIVAGAPPAVHGVTANYCIGGRGERPRYVVAKSAYAVLDCVEVCMCSEPFVAKVAAISVAGEARRCLAAGGNTAEVGSCVSEAGTEKLWDHWPL